MSQFVKFIRTRIQELTASVEAQTTEVAVYERVLQIETAKTSTPTEESPSESRLPASPVLSAGTAAVELESIAFTGNKTALVGDIVKSYGDSGALPKDVDSAFTARKIKRSKNFIYNTLAYLVTQKKLHRQDGRYFAVLTAPVAQNQGVSRTKRKLSPEGLKRIREGVKKRWAAKRAADRAAAK
jgi:hypothetical protein